MIFQNARNQINRFLTHYLDTTQDREDPQTTVQTIRDGIEFKGANILILIFAVFIASLGLNTNSAAVIIGRHAYFSSYGAYHGDRFGSWYL